MGAEGTLGVITEATLKIYPMPVSRKRISIGFPSLKQSIKACIELVKVGITPETVYLFEYINCGQYLERAGVEVPGEFAAAILFEFSGGMKPCRLLYRAYRKGLCKVWWI